MKKKEYRFPFKNWALKIEANNLSEAKERFRVVYKGNYDYNKIQEL